jgi:ferredoxin
MSKVPFVDQNMCISCGICADNLPDVFHMSTNGKAECFDPSGAMEEEIQMQAIDLCPVTCIGWK